MSVGLYMDHNVHGAITEGLRLRGVDCLTAMEDSMADAPDDAILARAQTLRRVIFTQDVDFLILTARALGEGRAFGGVIYGGQMSITIGQAIRDLELVAKCLDYSDMENVLERLPLR
jgi:hypothetical protein